MRKNLCYGDEVQFELRLRGTADGEGALFSSLYSEGAVDNRVLVEIMKAVGTASADQVQRNPPKTKKQSLDICDSSSLKSPRHSQAEKATSELKGLFIVTPSSTSKSLGSKGNGRTGVVYGDEILLKHSDSGFYLNMTTEPALEEGALKVKLEPHTDNAALRVIPGYKSSNIGDKVQFGHGIALHHGDLKAWIHASEVRISS